MTRSPSPVHDHDDEVARQRQKRAEDQLDRPVAGFDDLTLRDVIISVVAATEESQGPLDVDLFLTERGHVWQTVEMVHACLAFVDIYVLPGPGR